MVYSQLLAAVFIVIIGFFTMVNPILVIGCVFISSIFCELISIIGWATVSDCSNYSLLKYRVNITGIISGGMLFATKLGMAIGGGGLCYRLALYGYDPDAPRLNPEQLFCFCLVFLLSPAILPWVARLSFLFFTP